MTHGMSHASVVPAVSPPPPSSHPPPFFARKRRRLTRAEQEGGHDNLHVFEPLDPLAPIVCGGGVPTSDGLGWGKADMRGGGKGGQEQQQGAAERKSAQTT